ncbi:DUF2523 domain-containing protein [Ectopseudomonas oleovorans]|uniref:DUF2523 domain-containing protein n=1 Tax=Ectopseudomonas oleovorans TaxID=301 RepID=A0AA42QAQ1_ECTOL|nr:DUF2523 domain-containing protein [Pseudomonas oleovorans]MDH1340135.1 DUF2523 domain-containing protein [Pseudomonas oleovorans]MDH1494362.1 DUF2523 domain-containing protein [Pseudomonas oleovorans]WGG21996.1 DUF2523 domain-containing protein [Pseudomonas oleovorans]
MHFFYLAHLFLIIVLPIVKQVLRAIGIGVVAYVGINLVINEAKDYAMANLGTLGQSLQMILGLAKFDVAVNIYFAAITTRLLLVGIDRMADRRTKLSTNTTFTA